MKAQKESTQLYTLFNLGTR